MYHCTVKVEQHKTKNLKNQHFRSCASSKPRMLHSHVMSDRPALDRSGRSRGFLVTCVCEEIFTPKLFS